MEQSGDWITNAWRGYTSLVKVFWIYNVLAGLTISLAAVLLGDLTFLKFILFALLVFPYSIFLVVATWRCAFNTDYPVFGYIARGYVILAVLGAIGLI